MVDGKMLSKNLEWLDAQAKQLKVTPLMEFHSVNPDELAGFYEAEEIDLPDNLPEEKWFEAEEGLKSINAFINVLETGHPEKSCILVDLKNFSKLLSVAAEKNVRWHIAADF